MCTVQAALVTHQLHHLQLSALLLLCCLHAGQHHAQLYVLVQAPLLELLLLGLGLMPGGNVQVTAIWQALARYDSGHGWRRWECPSLCVGEHAAISSPGGSFSKGEGLCTTGHHWACCHALQYCCCIGCCCCLCISFSCICCCAVLLACIVPGSWPWQLACIVPGLCPEGFGGNFGHGIFWVALHPCLACVAHLPLPPVIGIP